MARFYCVTINLVGQAGKQSTLPLLIFAFPSPDPAYSCSRDPVLAPETGPGTSSLCSKYPTYNWVLLLTTLHSNYLCVSLSPRPNYELF